MVEQEDHGPSAPRRGGDEHEVEREPESGALYRHHKGGLYRVLAVGQHTETKEQLVVYQSTETKEVWVRPLAMWNTPVAGQPRFAKLPKMVM